MSEILYATIIGLGGGMIVGGIVYRCWKNSQSGMLGGHVDTSTLGQIRYPRNPLIPWDMVECMDASCGYCNIHNFCILPNPTGDIHGCCASRIIRQSQLRPAKPVDQKRWMLGFILNGGRPTHRYDYPVSRSIDSWLVVSSDFTISPRYGSNSRHYILEKGVEFLGGDRGHSTIHFMDDGSVIGDYAPLYSDTVE